MELRSSRQAILAKIPASLEILGQVAYNLYFSWEPQLLNLFQQLNPLLWEESGHNPVYFLKRIREEELQKAAQNSAFGQLCQQAQAKMKAYLQAVPKNNRLIAYFSAEFGLHESLPIYSGGLGILAGDHLKAASDLNLALVGVGLLYRYGYFVQRMDSEGRQEAEYYYHHFHELPIIPVKGDNGQDLVIGVEMPGRTVWVKIWLVQVGRIRLYLLDTDTGRNCRSDRDITAQLYGGSSDTRLSQELILGLGGVKALRALGLKPDFWHINEGHAVFLALERLREKIQAGQSLEAALLEIRRTTLFTTHTPVPAGHDQYGSEMIKFYFYAFCRELKLEPEEFLQWGWNQGQFNLTALAFYLAGRVNGVSQLHGRVSQKLTSAWQRKEQKPVFAITNGIHLPSFLAGELKELLGQEADWWEDVDQIADKALWQVHQQLKEKLVQFVRRRVQLQLVRNFAGAEQIAEVENYLDSQIFTLGFARRFATYKRADLLFRDLDRLRNLKYPWQIILAGKAHPADRPGQALLQHLFKLSQQPEWKGKIVFLENYDLEVARYLVQGVDLWLNTPRRPLEASGTSGMKAALNGVLHCSVLDGWWPEAYNGQNGFAFGHSGAELEEKEQDFQDWLALLELLEQQILPLFYARNSDEIPEAWVKMMKNSIKTIAPQFSAIRMVREYAQQYEL